MPVEPPAALTILRDHLAKTEAGAGRLVLVSGGLSSGKTALQNSFLQYVLDSGTSVGYAAGAGAEQALEGGVVDQLLRSAEGVLPEGLADHLTSLVASGGGTGADDRTVTLAIRQVCDALLQAAARTPLVLAVDDLQFVDNWSLQLFLQLQRRIRSVPLMLVLNEGILPHGNLLRFHAELTRQPHHQIYLGALSRKSVGDIVSASLGRPADEELARRFHELSSGNPMLLKALVQDFQDSAQKCGPVAGNAFGRAVLVCLHRWDPGLMKVAQALAVLDGRGSTELVAELAGITPDVVREVTGILSGAGLVEDGLFRHEAARAAVLDGMTTHEHVRLHGRAAELLYRHSVPAEEIAAHLVAFGSALGDWSVPVLREAGEQAALADRVDFAADCLELALAGTTDQHERMAIRRTLTCVRWRVKPSATSPHVKPLRQAVLEGGPEANDSVPLLRHALWNGEKDLFDKVVDVLAGSREVADEEAKATVRLAYQWYYGPGRTGHPDARIWASAGHNPWTDTADALARVWTHGGTDGVTVNAERLLQSCPLADTTLEALATAIVSLSLGGRTDRAEWWCGRLVTEAERRGAATWRAMLGAVRAGVTLRRGELTTAQDQARAALHLLDAADWGVSASQPLTALISAQTALGRHEDAARTLQYPVPEAMFETVGGLQYLLVRGRHHLAAGRTLAAVSDFERCRRLVRERGADHHVLLPWRGDLAEANVRLGYTAVARELAAEQLRHAQDADSYAQGAALRVLASIGERGERRALLRRAAEQFDASCDRLELARTLAALRWVEEGAADRDPQTERLRMFGQAQAGVPGQAQGVMPGQVQGPMPGQVPGSVQAQAQVHAQAQAHAAAAAQGLGQEGARGGLVAVPSPVAETGRVTEQRGIPRERAGSDAAVATAQTLSDAERRVARLAAKGHTNRQISGELFITVSTVEQHLTKAYRKLGAKGRSDLGARLKLAAPEAAAQPPGPAPVPGHAPGMVSGAVGNRGA